MLELIALRSTCYRLASKHKSVELRFNNAITFFFMNSFSDENGSVNYDALLPVFKWKSNTL